MKLYHSTIPLLLIFGVIIISSCGVVSSPTPTSTIAPRPSPSDSPVGATRTPTIPSLPSATPRRLAATVTGTPLLTSTAVSLVTPTLVLEITPTPILPGTATSPATASLPSVSPGTTVPITTTGTITATPALIGTPATNVTKAQYAAAQVKWRSAGVEEYEMTVNYVSLSPWGGRWTLRVTDTLVEVVSYANNAGALSTPVAPTQGETLRFLTVDGLFRTIDRLLTTAPQPGTLESQVDYKIIFDPTLGYPNLIEERSKPGMMVTELSSTTVTHLRVLRRK